MTTTILSVEEVMDLMDAITSPAEAEGRELTEQEVTDWNALDADLTAAQARKDASDAVKKRHAEYRAAVTKPLHVAPKKADDADLNAAFTAYLRTGKENADIQELRNAQSEGVPTEGGFLVPPAFRTRLIEKMKAYGGLADVVDEITTETGNALAWPTLDDTTNTGEVVDEGGTFAGGADLVFGQDELSAYSYMAGGASGTPLRLSRELVQDNAFDIEGRLAGLLGTRMARIQATHLVSGTGVAQPKGIVTGRTGTGMYSGASDALVYADFLTVIHALDPAYRANCRWAFNDTFLKAVRGVLDTNGRPILVDGNQGLGDAPGGATILGYPVTVDQGFSNPTATSATVNFGVFGDLREGYIVRRVRQIELLVNPYSRMANRQIEYSAWSRMDATPQNTASYVVLTGTA